MSNYTIKIFGAICAAALSLIGSGCQKSDNYLRVDTPVVEVTADAQSVIVHVEASSSWYPYSAEEWLQASPDDSDPTVLRIVIPDGAENNSLTGRTGTVTVVSGDALTATIEVRQAALDAAIEVSPTTLAEFSGRGGTQQLTVVSRNIPEWLFANQSDWLTVTRNEGTDILSVSAAYSNNLLPRRDTIIVYTDMDGFSSLNDTIPVVQAGVDLALQIDGMEGTSVAISHDTALVECRIVSNYDWTVAINNGGVPSNPTGEKSDQWWNISFNVPTNDTTEAVTYTVTFTCNGEEYVFTIIQSAGAGSGGTEPTT
jgi:hypothetical protein